ncbi:peptidase S8/S53 domain-containing protein [Syncephalis fuscata]|nr:peptidase S8/S53 domain-containing protein [Syncephalis fuscata]
MKLYLFISSITFTFATLTDGAGPRHGFGQSAPISKNLADQTQNGYIIKLKPGFKEQDFNSRVNGFKSMASRFQHKYNYGRFQGFASKLSSEEIDYLQNDDRVEYIEPQSIMYIAGVVKQPDAPGWGLPRICNRNRNTDTTYAYNSAGGNGVDIWIIDTGIDTTVRDFGGRAMQVRNYIQGEPNTDTHGHGTSVAAVAGANTYGVAKRAKLYGIKVMNNKGQGSTADIVDAIQYVTSIARRGKTVLNLSFTGGVSRAINDAINDAVDAGVAVIVAAGNEKVNACQESPPSAGRAFAVAASTSQDEQALFSNYGTCTKMYAPGTNIRTLGLKGESVVISGTSMSAPFVAGAAAIYMSVYNYNNINDLYNALIRSATSNVITKISSNSPNRLLYSLP